MATEKLKEIWKRNGIYEQKMAELEQLETVVITIPKQPKSYKQYKHCGFRPTEEVAACLKDVPSSKKSMVINAALKAYFAKRKTEGFLY